MQHLFPFVEKKKIGFTVSSEFLFHLELHVKVLLMKQVQLPDKYVKIYLPFYKSLIVPL
jgi:hypothetical protein